jgi:hypothetical protein
MRGQKKMHVGENCESKTQPTQKTQINQRQTDRNANRSLTPPLSDTTEK